MRTLFIGLVSLGLAVGGGAKTMTSVNTDTDKKAVAALDTEYQAAVKRNDAATLRRV